MLLKQMARGFLDALYPPLCLLCGELSRGSYPHCCDDCFLSFEPVGEVCCPRCGAPQHPGQAPHPCLECIRKSPPFTRCRSLYLLSGSMAVALTRFKYGGATALYQPLVGAMAAGVGGCPDLPEVDLVVPVPLSWRGRFHRGYNQAALLSEPLARVLGVPVGSSVLQRIGYRTQVGLSRKARAGNAVRSFRPGRNIHAIKARKVLLFDDVYTTGATVRACSRILRRAGAQVFVLTLARAVGTSS